MKSRTFRLSLLGFLLVMPALAASPSDPAPSRPPPPQAARKAAAAPAAWQDYRSKDGGFTALFPGVPKTRVEPADAGGALAHEFAAELGDMSFVVSYFDFPPNSLASKDPERILDVSRDSLVKGQPVSLLTDKPVRLDDHIGREVAFVDGDGYAQTYRIYVVKDRLYQTISGTPKGLEKNPAVKRFHDSFRLSD